MDQKLFERLLRTLHPETLAHLVIDLEEAREDWAYYPEAAPPQSIRHKLIGLAEIIREVGAGQAKKEALDFDQILTRLREARQQEDWLAERNRQARQNWYEDYR